jgi:hypothetical protein
VAHATDLEDQGSRPAQANSSRDPISKIIRPKYTRGVAQAVEHLVCKHEVLNSNSIPPKKKKKVRLSYEQENFLVPTSKGFPILNYGTHNSRKGFGFNFSCPFSSSSQGPLV